MRKILASRCLLSSSLSMTRVGKFLRSAAKLAKTRSLSPLDTSLQVSKVNTVLGNATLYSQANNCTHGVMEGEHTSWRGVSSNLTVYKTGALFPGISCKLCKPKY